MQSKQAGVTLFVVLFFLLAASILVVASAAMINSSAKVISAEQFHSEAKMAANIAIEKLISKPASAATDPLLASGGVVAVPAPVSVDVDQDGTADYSVVLARPVCLGVHDTNINTNSSYTSPPVRRMLWDIQATVTDTATGASVTMHQGVDVLPDDYECPV